MFKNKYPILMYHQVGDLLSRDHAFHGLSVEPLKFREQMLFLKQCGFQGLSLRSLSPYLKGEKSGKVFAITFDDGFSNIHEFVMPILSEVGFSATCFFVSGQIGGSNVWDRHLNIPYFPCMSAQQIRDWSDHGHEVGAHTVDHVRLTQVSHDEANRQILHSRKELEDRTGQEITSFAYPYGDVSPAIRELVAQAGFSMATTTRRARASKCDDVLLLPRRNVRPNNGRIGILRKCLMG